MATPFSTRKAQGPAPRQIGDNMDAADLSDFEIPEDPERIDTPDEVEPAGDVLEIPADSTPEGPALGTSTTAQGKGNLKDMLGGTSQRGNFLQTPKAKGRPVKQVANNEPFKAIVIGNAGVGKSRLTYFYVHKEQPGKHRPSSLAFELFTKEVNVPMIDKAVGLPVNKTLNVQFYDTAGQEKYDAITKAHYRRAMGALVCYSVADLRSFQAVDKWIRQVKENAGPHCSIILVGTKCDVDDSKREVQHEAGKRLSEFYGIEFFEVSAIQNRNVTEMVQSLSRLMIIEYEAHAEGQGKRPLREIDGRSVPGETEGGFTLGCCGTRKPRDETSGGCC